MGMSVSAKIFIFLVIISLVSFIYFRDRYEEPTTIKNPDNTTAPGCTDEGYVIKADVNNQSHIQCYKEAGFGHVKLTFLLALAMAMWTGVGIVFYIEYKKKDDSSVLLYYEDKYQQENKPIPKCPDVFYEKGFIWTFKGFDRVISSTEPELHIGKRKMISPVGKNLLYKGAREEISPLELYYYIGKDTKLFKRITGANITGFLNQKIIRKEEGMPKIYYPRPLSYEALKSFYSLKGNYGFESNRFTVIIGVLFQMKRSIELLDRQMDATFKSMMKKGEDYCAATARTGREADRTRDTKTADSSKPNPSRPQGYEPDTRREM